MNCDEAFPWGVAVGLLGGVILSSAIGYFMTKASECGNE